MAYELKRKEEEEGVVGANGQETPVIGAPQETLSAGDGQKGEAPGAQLAQKQAPEQGGITDVGKYLDVNQQKARQLAQETAGLIGKEQTEAQEAIQGAGTQFKQDVTRGTVALDQDYFNRAREALTGGGSNLSQFLSSQVTPQAAPAFAGPSFGTNQLVNMGKTITPAEKPLSENPEMQQRMMDMGVLRKNLDSQPMSAQDAFSRYYNATYGGPQDIASQQYYSTAQKEAQQAQEAALLAQSAEGRKELLARLRAGKTGRYTRGGLNLDQALIAGDQEAINAIQAQARAGDSAARLEALRQMAQAEVQRGQNISEGTRAAFQREFDIAREEQELADLAGQRRSEAETAYNQQANQIRNQYGTQEGIDINSFISGGSYGNINPYNVASSSDYARLQALQDLTGRASTYLPYAGQAGQYSQYMDPSSAFNVGGYLSSVDSARSARLAREEAARQAAAAAEAERIRREEEERRKQNEMVGGIALGGGPLISRPVLGYIGGTVGNYGGDVGQAVGDVITGAGDVVGDITEGVGSVITSICFAPDTPVAMADGTTKKIKNIVLHDDLAYGGRVYGTYQFKNTNDLYEYPSIHGKVLVTADHAVEENGRFIRVKDSKKAVKLEENIPFVYSLSNENHRIFIDGVVFADYDEVDSPEGKSNEECLKELNGR